MDVYFLSNVLAYSAQVAAIAALGTLLSLVVRVDSARVRYAYWRALLAACIVLPWVQGRQVASPQGPAGDGASVLIESVVIGAAGEARGIDMAWWVTVTVMLGLALRLIWIVAGLARLRRLRAVGDPASDADHGPLQQSLGTAADVRYVEGLTQPATFGVRRAVVLLPGRLRDQPADVRRAVLCHELLHVSRGDWRWVLCEEAVRAALWFHPAVWWLIARIQLSREEVVDAMAVEVTGARRSYIEALLAFADETLLAPAPAFARRRHLFRRIMLVSKDAAMSTRRLVLSSVLLTVILAFGTALIVQALPLTELGSMAEQSILVQPGQDSAGPLERRANRVTPDNPMPRRLASAAPVYPAAYIGSGIRATIFLRLVVDASGYVAEARSLTEQARRDSLESSSLGDHEIAVFRAAALEAVHRWLYAPPADPPIAFDVAVRFAADGDTSGSQLIPPPPPPPPSPAAPLRVGGNITAPRQIKRVDPTFPPLALASRVQGVVILEVTIGTDGRVADASVLRSIPLLDQAALDAAKQWEYEPVLLNGAPVPIMMTVTMQFILPEIEPAPRPEN